MPVSCRPTFERAHGFTLIEILVVVVIVAIMATVMTVAVGALGSDRQIDDERQRLSDVLAVALEQAELEGRDYGLRLEPGGYEVMVFDGRRGWTSAAGDRWFGWHDFPAGISVSLEAEGRRILLKVSDAPEGRLPQLITFGSGDVTPFVITLTREPGGTTETLEGEADGTMKLGNGDVS